MNIGAFARLSTPACVIIYTTLYLHLQENTFASQVVRFGGNITTCDALPFISQTVTDQLISKDAQAKEITTTKMCKARKTVGQGSDVGGWLGLVLWWCGDGGIFPIYDFCTLPPGR